MSGTTVVGIVGINGDLGTRLHNQIMKAGGMTIGVDLAPDSGLALCMDSTTFSTSKVLVDSIVEMTEKVSIIHWCAPLGEIKHISHSLGGIQHIILHDSVMAKSASIKKLFINTSVHVEIVHALMNDHCRVMIAKESDDTVWLKNHLENFGLSPKQIQIAEHDRLMAESQSLISLLCRDLLPQLKSSMSMGDLTPSGEALMKALNDRESHWTQATIESILANPELEQVLFELRKRTMHRNGKIN